MTDPAIASLAARLLILAVGIAGSLGVTPLTAREPTAAEVAYGPHERNVLDFWQAEGDGPRPLLVYIHGGGWVRGDKSGLSDRVVQQYLDEGISCAAINYRLTPDSPLPAPVHDAARAIQFLRTKASSWNIDQSRIALTGGSAGACTSMWILLHDDLANPNANDPVERESTRVSAAAVHAGQTSIDPKVIREWLGPKVLEHRMINYAVGEPTIEAALQNYEQHQQLYEEFSPYNHLDGNDPPLLMTYGKDLTLPSKDASHGIHHPVYGLKMKEKADRVGHECYLLIDGVSNASPYASPEEFLKAKLLGEGEWVELISDKGPVGMAKVSSDLTHCGDVVLAEGSARLEPKPGAGVVAALTFYEDREDMNLVSAESFGDCEVELEFLIGRGSNSGVKLHHRYEVQLKDSHGKENPTARDCGGVYPHWLFQGEGKPLKYIDRGVPPRINAAKPAGDWQRLKIVFRAPRFDSAGKKTENARFASVVLNGQPIHEDVELDSPTGNASTPLLEVAEAPLMLQTDHGPIAFRNVRIRRLED